MGLTRPSGGKASQLAEPSLIPASPTSDLILARVTNVPDPPSCANSPLVRPQRPPAAPLRLDVGARSFSLWSCYRPPSNLPVL